MLLARKGSINVAEWVCLSWLFGVCAISFLLWVGGNFSQWRHPSVVGWRSSGGLGGARSPDVGAFATGDPGSETAQRARMDPVCHPRDRDATIFMISFQAYPRLGRLLVWEIKARYAFLNGGVLPEAYFQGAGRSFSHPDYPLAIPFTQLWIYLWLGEANQFWAKDYFSDFLWGRRILLALLASRITGRRWIGLLLAILLFFVPQASLSTGSAIVGYADFPLAILYLAAVGYLLASLRPEAM